MKKAMLHTKVSVNLRKSIDVNEAKISKLLQNITNPTSPTIHECISRIKHAFKIAIGPCAYHYYISGTRGGIYNISLPKNLVKIRI